ncbi:MAG: hypothetical protein VR78_14330 [Hoeflea sp. BRH_c9]|nr:MAG: hypothetical protein VR78_14330 [Hoeflea sp. BRH_c9]
MAQLTVLDTISDPGSESRANEDAVGHNESCVFVLDGATGLGGEPVMAGEPSDAAWLANRAASMFVERVGPQSDVPAVLAGMISDIGVEFAAAAGGREIPRYALPAAGFAMVLVSRDGIAFHGLGDCTVFAGDAAGAVTKFSALNGFAAWESDGARKHAQRLGGFSSSGSLLGDEETLRHLRYLRALQNTHESGVWTISLVPEAAQHIVSTPLSDLLPLDLLLCTDGFAALVDAYGAHSPESLMTAAKTDGLSSLLHELRHIERTVDPSGLTYPRYKQSDDATAVLVRISA